MKNNNSVHLEGVVESCKLAGEVSGKTVAKLSVITLHPKEGIDAGASPSQKYERYRHMVRLVMDGEGVAVVKSLERELAMEKASSQPDIASLHPCIIEGTLRSQDGENFVEASNEGFSLTDRVRTRDNNVAHIVGKVISTSYTDESARIRVATAEGVVNSFFPRSVNQAGWEAVSSGKLKKGDVVSMDGPMLSAEFSDGKKTLRTYMVTPHHISRQKLERKVSSQQTM